jgi:RNA 2',3'-cyclic 3'-phosphodiesterase
VRWVPPEKLHLTLVFLGSIDAPEVPRVAKAMRDVAAASEPFEVAAGESGGYAGGRRGGVAWLRLSRGAQEIAQLSLDLDSAIGSLTYDSTRAPRPHLTVARHVTDAALADIREAAKTIQLSWLVDRVVLFRSHPDPGGSRYGELSSAALGRAPDEGNPLTAVPGRA